MADFIDKNQVIGTLREMNPWWSRRELSVPEFKRTAFIACRHLLLEDTQSTRQGILLLGPRRVGKTTLLYQLADALVKSGHDPKSIIYVALDSSVLKFHDLNTILGFFHEMVHPEGQPFVLLLDEVQYLKGWQTELKLLMDTRRDCRIVATGSADQVGKGVESGVGRWKRVPLPALTFFEFLELKRTLGPDTIPEIPAPFRVKPSKLLLWPQERLDSLAAFFRQFMPHFNDYMIRGGFPESLLAKDTTSSQLSFRQDVVENVLKRDMSSIFGIRNLDELEKLFVYLCINTGDVLGVKTVADALGTTTVTVTNHLNVLVQSHLIYRLVPTRVGGENTLRPRYKFFVADAALRNAVLLRGESALEDPTEARRIVETTVFRHLYAFTYQETPEVAYWRDAATNREVDVVVQSPAYTIPMQVDYGVGPRDEKKVSDLDAYCSLQGHCIPFIITRSEIGTARLPRSSTTALLIPAHIFACLIGASERQGWDRAGDPDVAQN